MDNDPCLYMGGQSLELKLVPSCNLHLRRKTLILGLGAKEECDVRAIELSLSFCLFSEFFSQQGLFGSNRGDVAVAWFTSGLTPQLK